MAEPKRLLRWANPRISDDGTALQVKIETTDGDSFELETPITEIGDVISFFAAAADHLMRVLSQDPSRLLPRTSRQSWAPIPAQGLGFGAGRSPEETLLVVRLAGFELAFGIPSSELERLAHDFARTARTLSAGHGKPN